MSTQRKRQGRDRVATIGAIAGGSRVAIYARISKDPEGRELGVQRQEADCRARADREGWTVTGVYVDNDVSASGRSKKPRPRYEALIGAVEAGEVDRVLAYSSSRLTRRPMELERWIALHDSHGVMLHTLADGDLDFSRSDGLMIARIRASIDASESDRNSERVKRAQRQAREDGTRPVQRSFGWRTQTDLHEIEAGAIKDGIKSILEGGNLTGVAQAWNRAGLRTTRDKVFTPTAVKRVLIRPRNAGLVDHHGAILEGVKGQWAPLCSVEEFEALRSVLEDPVRRNIGATPKGVLTGAIWCGACDAEERMTLAKRSGGGRVYRCASRNLTGAGKCGSSISAETAERIVTDEVFQGIVKGWFHEAMTPDEGSLEELTRLRAERAALTTEADELAEAEGDAGALGARFILKRLKELDAERERLTGRISAIEARMPARELFAWASPDWHQDFPSNSVDLWHRHLKVQEAFEALDVHQRRAVLGSLVRTLILPGRGGVRGRDRVVVEFPVGWLAKDSLWNK